MPHIIIEHSSNLRARVDIDVLIAAVHETALATGVFPPGGTRTRGEERTDYRIADGHPDNAFVHVTMRIGHGRDAPTRTRACEAVFETVKHVLATAFAAGPLAISLEMQEIDPAFSYKHNNIHDYVARRREGGA